jgi:acyl-CoA thioesterase I
MSIAPRSDSRIRKAAELVCKRIGVGRKLPRTFALALTGLLLISPVFAQESTIVALGDSNTAGLWVSPQEAFPARLAAKLQNRGQSVQVVNAGIPGNTLEDMLNRIDVSVPPGTRLVIVQGGYNDLVNRVPPDVTAASLEGILARLRARHVKAVVCGFFDRNWDAIGRKLSARYGATFVPGSTCYDPNHAGPDGLHMSAEGHEVVAGRLARVVQPGSRHQ